MDVIGIDVVFTAQHRRAFAETLARRAAFAVGGVDAGDAQDTHCHAGAAQPSHRTLGIDAAVRAGRVRACRARLIHQRTTAIAVDAAGRAVDECVGQRAQAQCSRERDGASVTPPSRALDVGRWRQMQHARRDAGKTPQRARHIEIGDQRRDPGCAQCGHPVGRRSQRDQLHPAAQGECSAHPDIAATDDEYPCSPKARRPRANGTVD